MHNTSYARRQFTDEVLDIHAKLLREMHHPDMASIVEAQKGLDAPLEPDLIGVLICLVWFNRGEASTGEVNATIERYKESKK